MSETFLYGEFQPEDVLDGGLPAAPEGLEPGEWFPLPRWQDESFGAVLYVYRNELADVNEPWHEYEHEIEILRREDGGWTSIAGGGGSFVDPFHVSTDWLRSQVVVETGITGCVGSDLRVDVAGGLCSSQVEWVQVDDGITVPTRTRVETPTHAFLVGVHGGTPTTIRLLDASGDPLQRLGCGVEWQLG